MTGLQPESMQQSDSGDTIAVEELNQDLNQKHEQLQSVSDAQESLSGSQLDSIAQSDTGTVISVEEQNQEQEQTKSAAATVPDNPKIDPMLSDCDCLQSPELRALLEGFNKGDFDEGKKSLTWDDCALLEVAITRLLDKNQLKTRLAMLEARYETVAEPKKFELRC